MANHKYGLVYPLLHFWNPFFQFPSCYCLFSPQHQCQHKIFIYPASVSHIPTNTHKHTCTLTNPCSTWSHQRSISLISTDTTVIGFSSALLMNMDTHKLACPHLHTPTRARTHTSTQPSFLSVDIAYSTRRCILLPLQYPCDLQAIKQENVSSLILLRLKCFIKRNSILSQM